MDKKILNNKPWAEVLESTKRQLVGMRQGKASRPMEDAMIAWAEEKGQKIYEEQGWDKFKEILMDTGLKGFIDHYGPLSEQEKVELAQEGYNV